MAAKTIAVKVIGSEAGRAIASEVVAHGARRINKSTDEGLSQTISELRITAEAQSERISQLEALSETLSKTVEEQAANAAMQAELISKIASRRQTLLLISGAATVIAIVALVFALI
jgi:hypothetical protein